MRKSETSTTGAGIWTVLAKCHRALLSVAERSIAEQGLCTTDFMVLEALLHKGPLTISEIQQKVLVASGSMTAAVDRLENRELVVRKTTERDRRARVVELTSAGKRLVETAFQAHAADLEDVFSVLGQSEKQNLYGALRKLGRFAAEQTKAAKANSV